MSYSFSARGASVAEVVSKVSDELDKVVAAQPIHAADRVAALKAAESFLSVLPEAAENQDFYVSVSGSVGWSGNLGSPEQALTAASVNVSASFAAKEKA